MLEGVIPLETFPLVEWHKGELADVPSFTMLKTQICVTRSHCVKNISISLSSTFGIPSVYIDGVVITYAIQQLDYTSPTRDEEYIDPWRN